MLPLWRHIILCFIVFSYRVLFAIDSYLYSFFNLPFQSDLLTSFGRDRGRSLSLTRELRNVLPPFLVHCSTYRFAPPAPAPRSVSLVTPSITFISLLVFVCVIAPCTLYLIYIKPLL